MDLYLVIFIKFVITIFCICQFHLTYAVSANGSNVCNSTTINNNTTYFKNGSSIKSMSKKKINANDFNKSLTNTSKNQSTTLIYFCCEGYQEKDGKCIDGEKNQLIFYSSVIGGGVLGVLMLFCILAIHIRRRRKRRRGKLSFNEHFIKSEEDHQIDRDENRTRYSDSSFIRKSSHDSLKSHNVRKKNHCSKVILDELKDRFSVEEETAFAKDTNYEISPQYVLPLLHNKSEEECLHQQNYEVSPGDIKGSPLVCTSPKNPLQKAEQCPHSYSQEILESENFYEAEYEVSPREPKTKEHISDEWFKADVLASSCTASGYEIPDDHLYTRCETPGEDDNDTGLYTNCIAKTEGYATLEEATSQTYTSLEPTYADVAI